MVHPIQKAHHFPEIGVPLFWPFGLELMQEGQKMFPFEGKNMKFLEEVIKTQVIKPRPEWATQNQVVYALHTFTLRDFSLHKQSDDIPVLILPPYAGHTSVIADFHAKQSLIEVLLSKAGGRVFAADWHSATPDMKDYNIDDYLAELHVAISDLGGRVHLIGLCQGGWLAGLYTARFPHHVASLVCAGSPMDTQAGQGVIKEYVNALPFSFYEKLVETGGGLLKGRFMLEGFKGLHPKAQFYDKYVSLYEHIDDPDYIERTENFERWYEYTVDLPGRWYLQAVKELFKENTFVKGTFVGLGRTLSLKQITCPLYLLAGEDDDITPKEQVFAADQYVGTPQNRIVKELATGGHIGLFMGSQSLKEVWPKICLWLKALPRT